jgi:SAM-dependent methyltransferase
MELSEAISLLQNEYFSQRNPSHWADLGCGSGLFTFALAHLLKPGSSVQGVDKILPRFNFDLQPAGVEIGSMQLDFVADELPFQNLDGILMANSLHYVEDKNLLIKKLSKNLKPGGQFLIVEYDADAPVRHWVPYPMSFLTLKTFFENLGFSSVQKLGERSSLFRRANLYAALISP